MSIITTFEHQNLTKQNFINQQDFDWLIEQNFDGFHIERKHKEWQITISHYIGVIGLPSGCQLEILPKISQTDNSNITDTRQWLQQMLQDIWQTLTPKILPNLSNQQILMVDKKLPLNQWLIHQFWQLFQTYQPNQNYQTHEQNQPFLQGKLLIKQQLQYNAHQPHKFFHQTEQFIHDTACNRLVKTTLQTVIVKFNVIALPAIWQNIPTLLPNQYQTFFHQANQELQALPQIIGQQNSRLIEFCYIILTLQQAIGQGQTHSPTLLINMQFAFEKWIGFKIRQMFDNAEIVEQKSQHLTIDGRLAIKPDIWLKDKNSVKVIDIKWKNIKSVNDISLADMYQLMTYANEFGADEAWLIVPTMDKNLEKQPIVLANEKPTKFWLVAFDVIIGKFI